MSEINSIFNQVFFIFKSPGHDAIYRRFQGFEWVIVLIPFMLWCLVLVGSIRSDYKDNTHKIIWLIVVILMPFIGVILYPLIGPNQKLKASGKDY